MTTGIVNCFNIVFLISVVMKRNPLLYLTNITLFLLLNLQINQSFSIH